MLPDAAFPVSDQRLEGVNACLSASGGLQVGEILARINLALSEK
jgi:hypothetical protein